MPSVPTVENMESFSRQEFIPFSKVVSFQQVRNWEAFNAGIHPGDLVQGYGDMPLAVRLETDEHVIYDGNHRTDLAIGAGAVGMLMHVIDAKSYDPQHAGRRPAKPAKFDEKLLDELVEALKTPTEPDVVSARTADTRGASTQARTARPKPR